MKRRDFLTLSGLVLGSILIPSSIARAIRETCVLNEEPLLVTPSRVTGTLYAVDEGGEYTLHFGDPYAEPDPPTWEDWLSSRRVDASDPDAVSEWFRDQYGYEPGEEPGIDPKEPIDGDALANWMDWDYELQASPAASAYRYLSDLPLCTDRKNDHENPLGRLTFIEGDRPGSNLTYVEAADLSTLACLQHRLNELGEGTAIEIYHS
jgi:hypothetical protein